jgi:hypothetical protein
VAPPPAMDGALDDPAWRQAQPQTGFVTHGAGRPARNRTEFMLVRDDARLYLGARCYQDMTRPKAQAGSRDGKTWLDDAIELTINLPPGNAPKTNATIIVNVEGHIFDMKTGDEKWNADIRWGSRKEKDHWTLEFSVPWADMGLSPDSLPAIRLNVVRDANGAYTGGEISTWFPSPFENQDPRVRGWGLLP